MQKEYVGIVKKAIKAGVKIALGTDAGNYNYHGNNAIEIVYLAKKEILSPWRPLPQPPNQQPRR